MEAVLAVKPRVAYATFAAQQQVEVVRSVRWAIERYIADMASPAIGITIGASKLYILRNVQADSLGAKAVSELVRTDVIEWIKRVRSRPGRNGKPVCAATAQQYFVYAGKALKYVASAVDGCESFATGAFDAARPMLLSLKLIGKGVPRTRVPTDDELERIFAAAEARDAQRNAKVKLLPITLFALETTRRLGEICRLRWDDIDWERTDAEGNAIPMYLIRDVKHPTLKIGNHKEFALTHLAAEIIRTQERIEGEPRVFPYNSKSASQAFAALKRGLGIVGLRFHDCRRQAITRWLAKLKSAHKVKQISGHATTQMIERVYDATKPESVHADMRLAA